GVIRRVRPVCEGVMVLTDSEIGELGAYARRKGNVWFLAITGGPQPKTLHVPLSFRGQRDYKMVLVRDNPADDAAVEMENTIRRRTDSLDISLRGGGGLLARFTPTK